MVGYMGTCCKSLIILIITIMANFNYLMYYGLMAFWMSP